ncbi:choice-of-anchor A family protein [Streptomyces sp. NPDC059385]|uniref:choice-of-anchor A family protein n=1 Tax=Streptomyces sp. NPDC059385 TaxID=3346817 RepID=UPI0036B88D8A
MSAGNRALGLAVGIVLAAVGSPTAQAAGHGAGPAAAQALRAPLPSGLGPCIPGTGPGEACPPFWPEPNNLPFTGRDNNVNVFVGGNMLVRRGAAEAEGKVVVLGDFDMNKSAGGNVYNVGIAGVGSRVPPSDGSDFLTAGNDVRVAPGQRLLADGGVIRYGSTLTGTATGTLTHDPDAAAPYAVLRDRLTAASDCYADQVATGTTAWTPQETVFTGNGTSPLQVFNVSRDLSGPGTAQQTIRFAGIPAGATVLVNVLGASPAIRVNNVLLPAGLRERLLWNFPDADTAEIAGSAQLGGSVLIGPRTSVATVSVIGVNGRFLTAGSMTHTSPTETTGLGAELHAYPFDGDLPGCAPVPPVTGNVSVVKHDEDGNALAGAVFELWRETNGTDGLQTGGPNPDTKVSDCTTGTDGLCSREEEIGTYYWRETAAPPGYLLPDEPVRRLVLTRENTGSGVSVTAVNRWQTPPVPTGEVVLTKRDEDTGAVLPGARFELWRETNGVTGLQTTGGNADTRLSAVCVTDGQGTCRVGLPVRETYYWREIGLPDGYEPSGNPVTVFGLDEADTGGEKAVTITNRKRGEDRPGSIRVLKKDAKKDRPLPGAVFRLWRETNGTSGLQTGSPGADTPVGDECTTDEQGVCEFTPLDDGQYYVVETRVPDGYVLGGDPVTGPLTLDAAAPGHQVTVTLHNQPDKHDKEHKPEEHGKPGKPGHQDWTGPGNWLDDVLKPGHGGGHEPGHGGPGH